MRSQNHRIVLIVNVIVTAVGAGNSVGRTGSIEFRAKNLREFKFKTIIVPLNGVKHIIIVRHLTGPLHIQCCTVLQVIDLVLGRHARDTITNSSYGWIYRSEKSVEGLLEGLIFDIHDGRSDTVIQIEIKKYGLVNGCNQRSLKTH